MAVRLGSRGRVLDLTAVKGQVDAMVAAQVEAIRNLKIDKITVWDSGNDADGSSTTSNFVSSLVQSLPPIHDVAKMSGVELPDYLGSMTDEEPGS